MAPVQASILPHTSHETQEKRANTPVQRAPHLRGTMKAACAQNGRMSLYRHHSPAPFLDLHTADRAREFAGLASDDRVQGHAAPDERRAPWADLATWYRRLHETRRTLICEPHLVDELRAAVEAKGLADVITVTGSPVCRPGQAFVLNTPALDDNLTTWAPR